MQVYTVICIHMLQWTRILCKNLYFFLMSDDTIYINVGKKKENVFST